MLEKLREKTQKLNPNLRKIINSIGWLSVEKALNLLLNLTVGIYVIRYLGSDSFGKFSYCLSLVGMFEALAKLGLDAIVVRSLVEEEKSTSDIMGTAVILKLLGSLLTLAIVIGASKSMGGDWQTQWIVAVMAWSLVFRSTEAVDFWFQSKVLAKPMAIVKSVKLILGSVLKIGFIFLKLPLAAFVWLLLAEEIFRAVTTLWAYCQANHTHAIRQWKFNLTWAKEMLRDSWPLILSGVMITIYMKIDQVMLGNLASNEAVGNYAAAVKFSEVWYFFPLAICTSVFPSILRAKQRGRQEYYAKLQQLYDLMAWISLVIAIAMTFVSGILVNALLGEGYVEAGRILALHIWAGPFVFLGVARSQWLMAENMTGLSFAATSLGTISNLCLNFWLIPLYEGSGAALATVISYGIASHIACIIYPQMYATGWMLTKALFVPLRIRQNSIYWSQIKKMLF